MGYYIYFSHLALQNQVYTIKFPVIVST